MQTAKNSPDIQSKVCKNEKKVFATLNVKL